MCNDYRIGICTNINRVIHFDFGLEPCLAPDSNLAPAPDSNLALAPDSNLASRPTRTSPRARLEPCPRADSNLALFLL